MFIPLLGTHSGESRVCWGGGSAGAGMKEGSQGLPQGSSHTREPPSTGRGGPGS